MRTDFVRSIDLPAHGVDIAPLKLLIGDFVDDFIAQIRLFAIDDVDFFEGVIAYGIAYGFEIVGFSFFVV